VRVHPGGRSRAVWRLGEETRVGVECGGGCWFESPIGSIEIDEPLDGAISADARAGTTGMFSF
jgi:hypothetical protein